jgi:hypothetical protein
MGTVFQAEGRKIQTGGRKIKEKEAKSKFIASEILGFSKA